MSWNDLRAALERAKNGQVSKDLEEIVLGDEFDMSKAYSTMCRLACGRISRALDEAYCDGADSLEKWPSFEDGSHVRIGDKFRNCNGDEDTVVTISFHQTCIHIVGQKDALAVFYGETVPRPDPDTWEKLAADLGHALGEFEYEEYAEMADRFIERAKALAAKG